MLKTTRSFSSSTIVLFFKESCSNSLFLFFSLFFLPLSISATTIEEAAEKLESLHSQLHLVYGSFAEEYPEQLMAVAFLPKNAKVLELGANVGRNSCIIASVLNRSKNLVSLESNPNYIGNLKENRDVNGLQFYIEPSALSKTPIYQNEWNTIPSNQEIPGWIRVNTITFQELEKKYRIRFDTLVVDCEGALYYILKEDPAILKNINLVLIENDFDQIEKMNEVQDFFKLYGLKCVYNRPLEGKPCGDQFYQVWKKVNRKKSTGK